MTPEQERNYVSLVHRCSPAGISVSYSYGPSAGQPILIISLGHPTWSAPIQRLLFPDGVMV